MYLRTFFSLMAISLYCSYAQGGPTQVYKCTDDGKLVYQQMPCKDPTHGEKLDVKPTPRSSEFSDREWMLIGQQKISVGMSERALVRSWGEPTTINRSSYGPAQWVYRRGPGNAQYVYVENGYVKNWSD